MKTSLLLLRLSLAGIFLWAFFDKLLGLGFSTKAAFAWLSGGSPTTGFLKMATYGPFKPFFISLAGSSVVDWLFMLGLLFVGTALLLGIARKLTAYGGTLMLFLMWLSMFPPKTNPLIDDHVINAFALWVLLYAKDQKWTLYSWWSKTPPVKSLPILE